MMRTKKTFSEKQVDDWIMNRFIKAHEICKCGHTMHYLWVNAKGPLKTGEGCFDCNCTKFIGTNTFLPPNPKCSHCGSTLQRPADAKPITRQAFLRLI